MFSTSQANPKYLPCISICCLFLAVKMCEEDEVITTCSMKNNKFLALFKYLSGGYNVIPKNIHSSRVNWSDILEGWWWISKIYEIQLNMGLDSSCSLELDQMSRCHLIQYKFMYHVNWIWFTKFENL